MISGLQQEDDEFEISSFVDALAVQLGACDASCSRTRLAADAVVEKVQRRNNVLPAATISRLVKALGASVDRAAREEGADVWGAPLYEQDDDEVESMWSAAKSIDDHCLSQSF